MDAAPHPLLLRKVTLVGVRSIGIGLVVLLGSMLVGCSVSSAGDAPTQSPVEESADVAEVEAAWLEGGAMIGVVTLGSSSCVPTATEVSVSGQVLTVELAELGDICTRDLVPRATGVGVPEGLDTAQDVTVITTGAVEGEALLAGVPGLVSGDSSMEVLPSAGWTGADGQFVILTWGSSSCLPMIESSEATGPAEVTVTFATPDADQVCTLDMAPQTTVAWVTELEEDADVEAVLTGFDFDGVRVPIIGVN
ncbi:hypothetical protein [Microbacterium sp. NPDC076911]|uniref:hypothetical protein n=1 Tax=Microbacterium sp. NPDC076911 TaxID=3154958 RepID=UPI00343B5A58